MEIIDKILTYFSVLPFRKITTKNEVLQYLIKVHLFLIISVNVVFKNKTNKNALKRDNVDNENAMLATNKRIHDNNHRIEYKQNNIAQTLKPYFCSNNIVLSPVKIAIKKT